MTAAAQLVDVRSETIAPCRKRRRSNPGAKRRSGQQNLLTGGSSWGRKMHHRRMLLNAPVVLQRNRGSGPQTHIEPSPSGTDSQAGCMNKLPTFMTTPRRKVSAM
jgi:hypothetical protein